MKQMKHLLPLPPACLVARRPALACLAILLLGLSSGFLPGAHAEVRPQDIEMQMKRNRLKRLGGGDFDDQSQRVRLSFEVQNRSFEAIQDATVSFVVIGEVMDDSIRDREKFKVLVTEKQKLAVEPVGKVELSLPEITLKFDESKFARHGERYFGYIAIVRGPDDRIWKTFTDRSTVYKTEEALLKIEALGSGAVFDGNLVSER
jgi:hypothetical protein